eukprot:gene9972-7848_t
MECPACSASSTRGNGKELQESRGILMVRWSVLLVVPAAQEAMEKSCKKAECQLHRGDGKELQESRGILMVRWSVLLVVPAAQEAMEKSCKKAEFLTAVLLKIRLEETFALSYALLSGALFISAMAIVDLSVSVKTTSTMQRRSSLKLNSLPSLCVLLASLLASDALQPVRVTFLTDCTPYSHCNGDHYAPYNKPEAVIDYLQHNTPEEEHIPEVTPRNDSLAGPVGRRGDQVGGFFFIHRDDLKKMSPLWLKYTEDVRFDEMAYKYSGDVYAVHPGDKPWISEMYGYAFGAAKANAYKYSGDVYAVHPGDKPWISEMYGYAFGAAKADVWHKWDTTSMIYPAYEPHAMPKLMHYGLRFEVEQYKFDKHAHFGFDALACPPWDMTNQKSGIMKQAPRVAELTRKGGKPSLYYQDLLAVEVVATINAGLCDFHLSHCSPSKELYEVCKDVWERYLEVTSEVKRHEASIKCEDNQDKCKEWASSGECVNNLDFMEDACMKSCGKCIDLKEVTGLAPASSDYPTKLEKLAKDLGRTSDRGAAIAQGTGLVPASSDYPAKLRKLAEDLDLAQNQDAAIAQGTGLVPASSDYPTKLEKLAKDLGLVPNLGAAIAQAVGESSTPLATSVKGTATTSTSTTAPNSPPPLAVRRAANVWPPRQPKMPPPPSPPWNTPVHQNEKVHCLRLALSMEETKKCVEAVKKGETYIPKDTHTSNVRRLGSQYCSC